MYLAARNKVIKKRMVSVEEAERIVSSNLWSTATRQIPITEAAGSVLAEAVRADRPFPPFARVSMDGIAIRFSSWLQGQRSFTIQSTQAAGEPAHVLRNPLDCIEVMTGAVLPDGADTVIRYEDLSIDGTSASVVVDDLTEKQNVHHAGADVRAGEILLEPGIVLSAAEVALLAAVGKSEVLAYRFPSTAIISTGDELVGIEEIPLPHQIRGSNVYALQAAMQLMQWPSDRYHVKDDDSLLEKKIQTILSHHEVLIISGGVSKGKFDFVPQVLSRLGVQKLFHHVNQRPGKPFWFGASKEGKVVFALPGNPVSTYLCFYRYVRPWMLKSLSVDIPPLSAVLKADVSFNPSLTYFISVNVTVEEGRLVASPVAGGGSGDFANLKKVHGFLQLPPDRVLFRAGEVFPLILFRPLI
jgi:molybdopterin molybdotransferase